MGMDPQAGCLLSDEYLMGPNGDLRLRSVALSFPTHTHTQQRVEGGAGRPASILAHPLVDLIALSCRVTQQLPLISSCRLQG